MSEKIDLDMIKIQQELEETKKRVLPAIEALLEINRLERRNTL